MRISEMEMGVFPLEETYMNLAPTYKLNFASDGCLGVFCTFSTNGHNTVPYIVKTLKVYRTSSIHSFFNKYIFSFCLGLATAHVL